MASCNISRKQQKKHSTELERLEINLKGWKKEDINPETFVIVLANAEVTLEDEAEDFTKVISEFVNDAIDFITVSDSSDDLFYLI